MKNVTVKLGQEAVLSCSVTSRGDFKVGWIKVSPAMVSIRRILLVVVVEVRVKVMLVVLVVMMI